MLIQLHPRPVSVAHVKSTSDISSPCIKVCIIESDYCIGCGRTLDEIGEWLKFYGKSVYGAEAFDLRSNLHDWGLITYKHNKQGLHNVFLNIFDIKPGNILNVTGITQKPLNAFLISKKSKIKLNFDFNKAFLKIKLPTDLPDPYVNLIELEYDKRPTVDKDLVAKSKFNGYSLKLSNSKSYQGDYILNESKREGSIPSNIQVNDSLNISWKIFVDKPSKFNIDTSYNFQSQSLKERLLKYHNRMQFF